MSFDLTNEEKKERALLIAVDTGDYDYDVSMAELGELASTAGAQVVAQIVQKDSKEFTKKHDEAIHLQIRRS